MAYQQLTPEQRYQIYALQKAHFNQTEIAAELGVHKATVSREVRRGRGGRGYRPQQAQALTVARLELRARPRIQPETWRQVGQLTPRPTMESRTDRRSPETGTAACGEQSQDKSLRFEV